jgi:hypothetical protein
MPKVLASLSSRHSSGGEVVGDTEDDGEPFESKVTVMVKLKASLSSQSQRRCQR